MKLFPKIFALCLIPLSTAAAPDDWNINVKVARGDCLWKIAGISFSDPFLWPLIYQANQDLIQNPDLIQPGWSLSMPLDPSESELAEALLTARLYKESMPVPGKATASVPHRQVVTPVAEETGAGPQSRLPFDIAQLTILGYALYLLLLVGSVGIVSLIHMFEAPHHEKESVNPMGLHLMPWASIHEISGNAAPETDEDELQEAA